MGRCRLYRWYGGRSHRGNSFAPRPGAIKVVLSVSRLPA